MAEHDSEQGTWEDVTRECKIDKKDWDGGCVARIGHNGISVGYLAEGINVPLPSEYRVTTGNEGGSSGYITIEHFIPDPEPVIAYKAVRVDEDGVMRSIFIKNFAGAPNNAPAALEYRIGETVIGGECGIFCFDSSSRAREVYRKGKTLLPRFSQPMRILEVEAIGEQIPEGKIPSTALRIPGCVNYPSVKVLSVAWEEEKKEEWVDVTADCQSEFGMGYVRITHNGTPVADLGARLGDKHAVGYRITPRPNSIDDTQAGFIKVEEKC